VARVAGERQAAVDGTAEYVDPAVARGGTPGPASDVWALAAVCHQMLSGSPPHDGSTVGEVLDAAVGGERAPLGLLAPSAPRALVAAVEAALVPEPADRPDAAAFAALLRRAHAAAPVLLTGGLPAAAAPPAARPTHAVRTAPAHAEPPRRRRLPPGVLLATGLVLLLVLGALGGWLWGRRDGGPAPALPGPRRCRLLVQRLPRPPVRLLPVCWPVAVPLPAAPAVPSATSSSDPEQAAPGQDGAAAEQVDWAAVLDELDAGRAQAFASGEPARLAEVYAPASAGLAADAAALRALSDRRQTAEGVRHAVRSVELLEGGAGRARLRVVDVMSGYQVADAEGAVVSRAPGAGRRSSSSTCRRHRPAGGWSRCVRRPPDRPPRASWPGRRRCRGRRRTKPVRWSTVGRQPLAGQHPPARTARARS
jgi:hypothetical protein